MLVDKYKPNLKDIKGNPKEIKRVLDFVKKFDKERKNAVLISGPNGVGKTLIASLIAEELKLELMELNASDNRNAENLEKILGEAIKQGSLFFNKKLFLIDDIDGISGIQDKGSIKSLIMLIDKSKYPFIITCNEHKLEKLDSLKKKCLIVEFSKLKIEEIFNLLEEVCLKENISYASKDLRKLARYSNGDARAALNDLQSLIIDGKLNISGFEPRQLKEEIEEILTKIFKGRNFNLSLLALENSKISMFDYNNGVAVFGSSDFVSYWIEENLNKEFFSNLGKAYSLIGESDRFYGRIIKRQHWRFLVYCSAMIAGLSSLDKEEKGVIKYSKNIRNPKNNFRLWKLINKRQWIVSEKIGVKVHASKNKVVKDILPYIKLMSRSGVEFYDDFVLNQEEHDWLRT